MAGKPDSGVGNLGRRELVAMLTAAAATAAMPVGEAQAQLRQRDPYARRRGEARGASADGKIVLLYGEGIVDTSIAASILEEDGYPVTAMDGGRPGQITVYIDRWHEIGPYDQSHLDRGALTSETRENYDRLVGPPAAPVAALNTGPG